jgi:hypothetical protein
VARTASTPHHTLGDLAPRLRRPRPSRSPGAVHSPHSTSFLQIPPSRQHHLLLTPPIHSTPLPFPIPSASHSRKEPTPWGASRGRSTSSSLSSASRRATPALSSAAGGAARAPPSPPPTRATTRCASAPPRSSQDSVSLCSFFSLCGF